MQVWVHIKSRKKTQHLRGSECLSSLWLVTPTQHTHPPLADKDQSKSVCNAFSGSFSPVSEFSTPEAWSQSWSFLELPPRFCPPPHVVYDGRSLACASHLASASVNARQKGTALSPKEYAIRKILVHKGLGYWKADPYSYGQAPRNCQDNLSIGPQQSWRGPGPLLAEGERLRAGRYLTPL